ncbi:hypothetical protein JG687_00013696 [Phytophthora cactorum]|uniref:Uncharacterized protein n=1 Tax=Phytophthora cactorum TaxID=29920 RepID=A0A8T1TY94_9STRA|nr:hypothetical protein JG687_00013696 [Phytophthora cactorum]
MRGYIRQQWCDIWFTSYTFRRAGAQSRFMFAPPERRWSLRMVKWWAEWTQNESAETLVQLGKSSRGQDRHACLYYSTDRPTVSSSTHENATRATSAEQISILPPAKDWKDMYQCIGTLMRRVIYSSMSVSGHLWRERRVVYCLVD